MSNPLSGMLASVEQGTFGQTGTPKQLINATANQVLTNDLIKDWQHANILFTQNNYASSPKYDYLYYISFNINPLIHNLPKNADITGKLVKQLNLPGIKYEIDTLNAYNRIHIINKKTILDPISMTIYDSTDDASVGLFWAYYNYMYGNDVMNDYGVSNTPYPDASIWYYHNDNSSNSLTGIKNNSSYWGYGNNKNGVIDHNNASSYHFFDSIKVYIFHQRQYTCYHLLNPTITEFKGGALKTDSSGINVLSVSFAYEGLGMTHGSVDTPYKGDDDLKLMTATGYDNSASPLSPTAGGTKSITGTGGLLSSVSTIGADISSGNFAGAAMTALRGGKTWKGTSLAALGTMAGAEGILTVKNALSGQNNGSIFKFMTGAVSKTKPAAPEAPPPLLTPSLSLPTPTWTPTPTTPPPTAPTWDFTSSTLAPPQTPTSDSSSANPDTSFVPSANLNTVT